MKPSFETENHTIPSGIRVWNKTNGYLEVSSEGHLLQGQTAAWVEKSPENLSLVEQGFLEIIGMSVDDAPVVETEPAETPKKKETFILSTNGRSIPQFGHRRSSCCG